MKFAWHNQKNWNKADIVLFGVPDESGSHASRKGNSKGPNKIRQVSCREVFFRKGKTSVAHPQNPIRKKIFDYGNVKKKEIGRLVEKISVKNKIPITLGGDHSITFECLKGLNKLNKKFTVVYFDAHPDFICSSKNYYGSVVCDALELKNIDFKHSMEVGLRALETEEMLNIKRKNIKVFTAVDAEKIGINNLMKKIRKILRKPAYLSVDMDVIDPAFAPGVNTPVPGGFTSNEIIYLCKEISKIGLIGFDIMETSPPNDIQDMTSHLASKLILEVVGSLG